MSFSLISVSAAPKRDTVSVALKKQYCTKNENTRSEVLIQPNGVLNPPSPPRLALGMHFLETVGPEPSHRMPCLFLTGLGPTVEKQGREIGHLLLSPCTRICKAAASQQARQGKAGSREGKAGHAYSLLG